jgi:hypothetical protein
VIDMGLTGGARRAIVGFARSVRVDATPSNFALFVRNGDGKKANTYAQMACFLGQSKRGVEPGGPNASTRLGGVAAEPRGWGADSPS